MNVRRVVLVQHPAERMFDLIEGVEHYPAFLPRCARASILERSEQIAAATTGIDWHGVRFEIATRNRRRCPEWLELKLTQGPFRDFRGEWQLKPLGDDGRRIGFFAPLRVRERGSRPRREPDAGAPRQHVRRRARASRGRVPRPPTVAGAGRRR